MTTHLGIELSPGACRIVEIDAGSVWASRRGATRVRSFAALPPSGAETDAKLATLAGKPAAVIVWNAPSEHRQVVVTGGSYETMRAEALSALAAAGLQTRGVLADVSPAAGRPKRGKRQPVVVTLAASSDVTTALQPLRSAGIRVRTVTTPAAALGSLARLRRSLAVPGPIEAYIALEESITCVALVRDAILIAARELPWGYIETRAGATQVRAREEIAARLGDGIAEFVAAIGGEPRDIGQVCVAGGMPELRSMTAPLMERLDVEVEPLDSLFAIDAANLPESADEFRDRGAELRLAWAAAADWPPAINLLRARKRQVSRTMLSRAAVAAGVVAGLAGGWRVTQTAWWHSTARAVATRPATNANANLNARGRGTATSQPSTVAANKSPIVSPPATTSKPPQPTPPRSAASNAPANRPPTVAPPQIAPSKPSSVQTPPPAPPPKPALVAPAPVAVAKSAPVTTPPPSTAAVAAVNKPPASSAPSLMPSPLPAPRTEPPRTAAAPTLQPKTQAPTRLAGPPGGQTAQTTARAEPPATRSERPPVTRSEPSALPSATTPSTLPLRAVPPTRQEPPGPRSQPPPLRSEPAPAAAVVASPSAPASPAEVLATAPARLRPAPVDVPLGFDASLGTILYSQDRKLAIVDGRIVGVGDEIRGARIVDITPSAVMLRDAQGRLRRLALGPSGR